MSVLQMLLGLGYVELTDNETLRSYGFTVHPVLFGVEVFYLLAFIFYLKTLIGQRFDYSDYLIISISLLAMYLSYSRTAWIMLVVSMAVYLLLTLKSNKAAIIFLFAVVIFSVFIGYGSGRFNDLVTLPDLVFSEGYTEWTPSLVESSMHWRVFQWYELFSMAIDEPYFGYGPGQVKYYNIFELSAHNSFLDIFFEQGLVGLLLFILLWVKIIIDYLYEYMKRNRAIAIPFSIVISTILAMLFSVSLFNQTLNMILLWLLIGITYNSHFSARD
jgi:O-antigen ligase